MFRSVPFHRDQRIADALHTWNGASSGFVSPQVAPAVARRLFESWEDMQAFFSLAFPGYSLLDAVGVVRREQDEIGCLAVLDTLGTLKTTSAELEVAAFVVSSGNAHSLTVGGALVSSGSEQDMKRTHRFVKLFAGLATAEQLRNLFSDWSWRIEKEADWMAACLKAGMPYSYLHALVNHYNWVAHYDEWPVDEVMAYMDAGAPAAYLTHFWDWKTRFQKFWSDGLPYEYAIALAEEDA